jgi:hypothetical protein
MHGLIVGPHLQMPNMPALREDQIRVVCDTEKVVRHFRKKYDWKQYSADGLLIMEGYWECFVAYFLKQLLPSGLKSEPHKHRGINLGTFNGSFQKAWVKNFYNMYGIEIADVIDELHAYGMEGHRDSFFDMSRIKDGEFDFAVLERAICTKSFYDTCDRCFELDVVSPAKKENVPALFSRIFRIIRPGGALIGILYQWYSKSVMAELAKYGALTIWPVDNGKLGFQVVKDGTPTELPRILDENIFQSTYFRRVSACSEGVAALFLPTNEIIVKGEETRIEFGPRSRHWNAICR